ncbi:MAG: hypothetical protein WC006_08650 [Bacilli bacterium]|nr:hypothetical protein [Bacilli bacterium]
MINTYSYDIRGSITSIFKIVLQNGYLTSNTNITLNYSLSGWKDQLISVTINGVTHDNISN